MKKAGIILLLIACGLGVFFVLPGTDKERITAAECLPADVVFYGELLEFTEMYEKFTENRLGKAFSNLDYKSVGTEIGAPQDALLKIEKLVLKTQSILEDPGFNILFGKEISLAVIPVDSFSADNPAKAIEERLLFIARPRHNTKMLELITPIISKDIEQSTIQYGMHTITEYKIDKTSTLFAVSIKGLIVFAFEEQLIRESLGYYDNKKDTLASNETYLTLRQNFKDTRTFSYLSIPALEKQGRLMGESLTGEDREQYFTMLAGWNGWEAMAHGSWHEKGLVKNRFEVLFDRTKLDGKVARLCEVKPEVNDTLEMVPASSLFYYWTNTMNLSLLLELYSSAVIGQQPVALDILRMELRNTAGIELEELLETIDSEIALIIEDIDRTGVPLPKGALILELKNSEKFLRAFNVLLNNSNIHLNQKQYGDQEISYWGAVQQGGLQSAFTLIDNYFVISNSSPLVENIVDLQSDSAKQLVNSTALKEVGKNWRSDNNSVAYVHITKFIDALKDLAIWGGSMAVLQGPEMMRKTDIMLNQLVLPLLDGVSLYTQIGSRSYTTENSIIFESTTTVVE